MHFSLRRPRLPRRRARAVDALDCALIAAEALESRRLLAFSLAVNFQPAGAPVPSGYVADTGATYGNRGNGFTFGWNADNASATRDRNLMADQRYDTLTHTYNRTWEAAVPNGSYTVRLIAGDPGYFDSVYKFNVESVLTIDGTPTSGNRWFEATKTVTVSDGKLTITNGSGFKNNKLAFVEISDTGVTPPNPPNPNVPTLPGQIEAENFDNGGKGVSYHDTTAGNLGKVYRSTDVDVVSTSTGGYAVGFTRAGEWLQYTVNVATSGTYVLEARVASLTGGTFHLEVGGSNKTGAMTLPNTGGWQSWQTVSKSGISLSAGQHVMRLVFDSAAKSGNDIGNVDWLRLTASTTTLPTVSISAPDGSASEPGSNTGTFRLARTGSTSQSLTVRYSIGGSATNGVDYNTLSGQAVIAAGASSVDVIVTPKDDNLVEGTETVILTLSSSSSYTIGTASATVSIADDDTNSGGIWPTSWTVAQNNPKPRQEGRAAVVDGKLWVFGGFSAAAYTGTQQVDFFDVATDTWTTLKSPGLMPHTHSVLAVDEASSSIYFLGGLYGTVPGVATNKVFKFNTVTQAWSELPSMPENHQGGGAALVNGKLHYFGGSLDDRVTDTARHVVLDLTNLAAGWQAAPDMPNARSHFSTIVLGGKIYAIGGQYEHDQHLDQLALVHRYDPVARTWQRLADMPTPKSHAESSTYVWNGKIVVAGGQIGRFGSTAEVVAYDPSSNTWSATGSLPAPLQSTIVLPVGNKLVVTTGNRGDNVVRGDTWVGEL